MDQITLRLYRPGDWEAMHALDLLCFGPAFQFSRRAMRSFAEARGAVAVLAEADGELAGFCIAELGDRTGYIVTLDVAPARRREGLGRQLMAYAEAGVAAADATVMTLHVFTENRQAIHFYEGIGYGQTGMTSNFYGPSLDALVYAKQLRL